MVVTGTKDRTFLVSYVQKTSLVFMFIFKVHYTYDVCIVKMKIDHTEEEKVAM